MSISDRLAALGIESEAVREYDTWAEAPPAIYQSSILMQDKADAAIESLLDEVEQREARRCGTCALWQEWKPGSWDCAEEWCGYSTNPETFGCTHWEQRREG